MAKDRLPELLKAANEVNKKIASLEKDIEREFKFKQIDNEE